MKDGERIGDELTEEDDGYMPNLSVEHAIWEFEFYTNGDERQSQCKTLSNVVACFDLRFKKIVMTRGKRKINQVRKLLKFKKFY